MTKKTKKIADPLEIPKGLRRKPDKEKIDKILRQETKREWIMPDVSKKEKNKMSKQIECSDPALPVEVNLTIDGGGMETKKFENMNEFIDWYDPKVHELEGSIADASITMVSVKEKERPRAKRPDPEPEAAPVTTRGAVIKKPAPVDRPKKPRGMGFTRHHCRVGNETFTSVYKAFVGLSLSIPAHTRFRAELKKTKDGKMTYEEKGKKYLFERVDFK